MDSRSTKKNKSRVLASRRRISSILNLSSNKLNASKGDIKRKINVLIKNNKALAMALQDARCELSSKQSLLETASEYFKGIMLARVKMMEMESALNSVLKDLGGTIQMLKVDNVKLSDITQPFQSVGKFKNKMKKIAEAIEIVTEEHSFLSEQDEYNEESEEEESPDPPISRKLVSSNFPSVPMEVTKDIPDSTSSETAILQPSTKNCHTANSPTAPVTPGSPSAKFEDVVDPCDKEEMTSISDNFNPDNGTGTPKLSLPTITPTIDLSKITGVPFSLLKNNDSSVKKCLKTPEKNSNALHSLPKENNSSVVKVSKIPAAISEQKSFLNAVNSKIPRFHAARNAAVKKTHLSEEVSKGKSASLKISRKENISIPKEQKEADCRRKTFVVKNSDPETVADLNEEEEVDSNDVGNEQNRATFTSRKTFVVKSSSTLGKKRKSASNKRKTFVKKCDKDDSDFSLKNRRGTFVVTDVNENCTEDSKLLTVNVVNSDRDNLVPEGSKQTCSMTVEKALPSASYDPSETTQNLNLFEKNCFNIDSLKISNQESISKELFSEMNSEETLKMNLQNTFALEKKRESTNDKRKTFVKKCEKNSRKSIKNKRGTFAMKLFDINEKSLEGNQDLPDVLNSDGDDLLKEVLNKPCAVDEALPSCEETQNLQMLKKNCFITDNSKTMNQKSSPVELLSEINSEESLKEALFERNDGTKPACNQDDTRVGKFKEIICEIDDLKSTILPQKPSIALPVEADGTSNKVDSSEAKASKQMQNSCDGSTMQCKTENFLLKNSKKRRMCVTISQDKHTTSDIGAPEKDPAIPQTSSKKPQVDDGPNNVKRELKSKSEMKKEVNNDEEGKSSFTFKETKEAPKSSKKYGIGEDKIKEKNISSVDHILDDDIIVLDEDDDYQRKSRKKFLEPSFSDCESISDIDFEKFEEEDRLHSMMKIPVRGKVSYSNKKEYVFTRDTAKRKPEKCVDKPQNCKNLPNETSESALNRNCEDNCLSRNLNQISENADKNNVHHSANPNDKKKEIGRECHVTFCDTPETLLSAVKITENCASDKTSANLVKIHNNSVPEILDLQNDKNVNILSHNFSPVISLDKSLNAIECDFKDRKKKSHKTNSPVNTSPKSQNIETDQASKIKKNTKDSGKDKTSKKKDPKGNGPKKKKKQVTVSELGKENVEDSQVNDKKVKSSNQNNKEKKIVKDNALVVEAEIHPLPQTLNQLDKNLGNTKNYEVAVILSDIFQSKKMDLLSVNDKGKEKSNKKCISSPLSNNYSNIPVEATRKPNAAKEGPNEDLIDCRRSKRARNVNYAEPLLNKKLRR